MTSRERFRKAISHQEPDRVPIDIGGDMHNGIHEVAYANLLKYLGEEDEIVRYDRMQHLAVLKESVYNRINSDTRYLFASAGADYDDKVRPDGSWEDEWGIRRKNVGLYDDTIESPISDFDLDKLKKYKWPDPHDPARFAGLRDRAKNLYENTDKAVCGANAASLFYLTSELVGYEEYMEKIFLETEMIEELVEKMMEWQIEFFDGYLKAIGDYAEMVWLGDDWGTQVAPLISPALFKRVFAGRYATLVKEIKKRANVKVALHTCGSVYWALEEFAKAGIDVVHPLQGDAAHMDDPFKIKKEFGKDLVFYSNLKNQTTLPHGTADEVEADVKLKIQALAPGGGYVMSGGHNIQADVPAENIIRMIDTTLKYGQYPIQ